MTERENRQIFNEDKNIEIGKTIVSDKYPNTIDGFWLALASDIIVKPFDFITVEHLHHHNRIRTIGMIQDLQTIAFADKIAKPIGNDEDNINEYYSDNNVSNNSHYSQNKIMNGDSGITVAKVAIIANSQVNQQQLDLSATSIEMPVGVGKSVKFANEGEVRFALGIPGMKYPIPAGIIEMSNGLHIPISLDISYIMGPDTTHVNASGISGNAKTSYLLFLLQSAYQKLKQYYEDYSIIIFNTKHEDLLHVDKEEHDDDDKDSLKSKEKFLSSKLGFSSI